MTPKRKRRLIAFELDSQAGMPLEPAASDRDWMDKTGQRFAYRCLPLVIANQAGWIIRCPISFSARWNGGSQVTDLKVRKPHQKLARSAYVLSHFGEGVLTFSMPYLFRTPRGINLWAKGPSNWIKDGIQPLEGIIETDWTASTFTMNWKMTRRDHTVRFEEGEPICMIVPIPRHLAESLEPVCQPLSSAPKVEKAYNKWRESRTNFNLDLERFEADTVKRGWQRDYMLGRDSEGATFNDHQTTLRLRRFRRES